jgi:hypothetical protein
LQPADQSECVIEGPFNGFLDGFIEDVGEEGDDKETKL